jgi:hypothetical protein
MLCSYVHQSPVASFSLGVAIKSRNYTVLHATAGGALLSQRQLLLGHVGTTVLSCLSLVLLVAGPTGERAQGRL